jgi:hypothetical protein
MAGQILCVRRKGSNERHIVTSTATAVPDPQDVVVWSEVGRAAKILENNRAGNAGHPEIRGRGMHKS